MHSSGFLLIQRASEWEISISIKRSFWHTVPPPSPFSHLLSPDSVPLPPRCHSVEVEESIGGLFEMQAQVWEHWAWEKNPFLFGLNGGIWKTGRFFRNSFSSRPRRLSAGQKHCCHSGNKASLPPNLIEFCKKKKKKKGFCFWFFVHTGMITVTTQW